MGTFGMLSRLLRGEHMPIFSFLLIFFSDLLPILTGLRRTIRIPYEGGWICETVPGPSVRLSVRPTCGAFAAVGPAGGGYRSRIRRRDLRLRWH